MFWRIISLVFVLCACTEFRISDEDVKVAFKGKVSPHFNLIETKHGSMHYAFTDSGRDTLVVFIHGSPGSWNSFIDYFMIDSLTEWTDILAVDRPGYGKSGFGNPQTDLKIQSIQIQQVLDQFPHAVKILVGHSLGGPIAVRMAMDYPNKFKKLILVAPSIDPKFEIDGKLRTWFRTPILRIIMPKEFWVSNEEIIPARRELEKMNDLWSNVKAKVVVIQGTNDSLVPMENVHYVEEMLPKSLVEIRLLEGVDHFIPWSHPEEIIRAILDH